MKKKVEFNLEEVFNLVISKIDDSKPAVYDGRKIVLDSFNYGDFCKKVVRKLKCDDYAKCYIRSPSGLCSIYMTIIETRGAYALTHRLDDGYIVQKEMLRVLIKMLTNEDKSYLNSCKYLVKIYGKIS